MSDITSEVECEEYRIDELTNSVGGGGYNSSRACTMLRPRVLVVSSASQPASQPAIQPGRGQNITAALLYALDVHLQTRGIGGVWDTVLYRSWCMVHDTHASPLTPLLRHHTQTHRHTDTLLTLSITITSPIHKTLHHNPAAAAEKNTHISNSLLQSQ